MKYLKFIKCIMNRAIVVFGALLFISYFINSRDFMYLYIIMFHFISFF